MVAYWELLSHNLASRPKSIFGAGGNLWQSSESEVKSGSASYAQPQFATGRTSQKSRSFRDKTDSRFKKHWSELQQWRKPTPETLWKSLDKGRPTDGRHE